MARAVPTNPRKSASQKRSQATVQALLDATARVLTREGYDRASTNRIAATAGVSVGSLYQYFPNKEALVAALVARHNREMLDAAARGPEGSGVARPGNGDRQAGAGGGRRPSRRSGPASCFRRAGAAHGPARQDRGAPGRNIPAGQELPGKAPERDLGPRPRFRDLHPGDHRRSPDPSVRHPQARCAGRATATGSSTRSRGWSWATCSRSGDRSSYRSRPAASEAHACRATPVVVEICRYA